MKLRKDPKWMLIAAMTIFGTIGFFVEKIPIASGERALYRAVMAVALIGVYLLVTRQKIPFAAIKKQLPLLVISGAAIGINWILLFEAYRYTTVSVATLSYYFSPVIVTALCPVLFREKLTGKQIFCFGMSTVGLIMVTNAATTGQGKDLIGILFGLGAAVFYSVAVLMNKYIQQVEGIQRTFLQMSSAAVVLLPYVLLTGGITVATLDAVGWICLLIVGFVHTGICYCLYFSAMKEMPGQQVAILSYIDPLVAVIVSVTLLHEPITWWQVAGGVLILGFALLNELSPKKKT